jgi:predicted DNA-binding transcriptional regulator YafY
MATNKNAILRFNVLDKCFRNLGRKYYFEDLLNAVNDALAEEDPNTSGIKTRQLREDLRFMRSEVGYGAPIITINENRRQYYRYEDSSFSINNSPINSTEASQMRSVFQLLSRFEGSPGFEWVSELSTLLKDKFTVGGDDRSVISYETNVDYKGYNHITPLFNAIVNKRALRVKYEPFGKPEFELTFHPHYLKQYNGRWFVLGLNEEYEMDTWNMALDRINEINEAKVKYHDSDRDWDYYFSDFIGVTKSENSKAVEVRLLFSKEAANYVLTKPVHQTQKDDILEDGSVLVRIKVIPNYELESLILSFGQKVKVLQPDELVLSISDRLKEAIAGY